jgi:long-chain acyl-CoA synthetase
MKRWDDGIAMRRERHFGDRVMACIAERPPGPYAAFESAVQQRPEGEALVCGELRLSYAALHARANRFAAGLAARGVGAGDRVALWLGNRAEFVVTLLAAWRLGAIAVPVGTRLATPEVEYIVQHCGAKVVVHDAELAPRLPALPGVLRIAAGGASDGSERCEAVEDTPGAVPQPHRAAEDDVAAVMYTSGTTGRPKGAMLTHVNFVHTMLAYRDGMSMGPGDRTVLAVPASHVTGLTANVLLAWAAQCTLVVMPEFKVRAFVELAARERMTHTVIVPAMVALVLLQPDLASFELTAWRIGGYGGAPMAEATIASLAQALPALQLRNLYGATESTGPITMLPSEYAATWPDSVGLPLPGAEIAVMDDAGVEQPLGSAGELWLRGPMVVPGYWDNAEATRASFVAGYWRSGDVGSVDAKGFVRVFDRVKDMLNRGGFKIYSIEVENTLLAHPAVIESAIVGRPCPVLGERVHAFVCLKDGAAAEADALRAFCAERLADYKVPETWTLQHQPLPRNANGKLLKRALRERLDASG